MDSLEARVARIEQKARVRLAVTVVGCLAVGAWLGAAADPTSRQHLSGQQGRAIRVALCPAPFPGPGGRAQRLCAALGRSEALTGLPGGSEALEGHTDRFPGLLGPWGDGKLAGWLRNRPRGGCGRGSSSGRWGATSPGRTPTGPSPHAATGSSSCSSIRSRIWSRTKWWMRYRPTNPGPRTLAGCQRRKTLCRSARGWRSD